MLNVIREFRLRGRRAPPGGMDLELLADAAAADPAEQPAKREALASLTLALAELPNRQREAIGCRYLRQMSVAETAEVMGCAQGTVKATVSAAMAKLKSALESGTSRGGTKT